MKTETQLLLFFVVPFLLTAVALVIAYVFGNIALQQLLTGVGLTMSVLLLGFLWGFVDRRSRTAMRIVRSGRRED